MRKMKVTRKTFASVCAAAMAVTLAIPSTAFLKGAAVETEAAEADSILETALVTYDFEEGTDALEREGEEYLLLEDGKPVVVSGDYAKVQSTALPEVVEDSEKGNVLRFKDSVKIEKKVKSVSDELDEKYPVSTTQQATILQQEEHIGGRVKLENPFVGKKLEGVTISYWVKVPEVYATVEKDEYVSNPTEEQIKDGTVVKRGANSTTVVFNNSDRMVMNKDDKAKYQACQAFDEEEAKDSKSDYYLGTQETYTDDNGTAYVVYKDYGRLVRLNPNYPDKTASDAAVNAVISHGNKKGQKVTKVMGGGWYVPDRASEAKLTVYDSNGKEYKIASLASGTTEDQGQYQFFNYRYAAEDDFENGYSSKSKIREESIKGSMQISTDNDFGFREDYYRTESVTQENGTSQQIPVNGSIVNNPNTDKNGTIQDFGGHNQFYFDGDEFVTSGKKEDSFEDIMDTGDEIERPAIKGVDTWHYVTIVIQNDWVTSYVDGVQADPYTDYHYLKSDKNLTEAQKRFGNENNVIGKAFNKGTGLRGMFALPESNISEWPKNGTLSNAPANALQITMLDWIADKNTELYLGGTSYCAEMLTQGYGTVDGVCLDDVSFFDKALDLEEAQALYQEAKTKKVIDGGLQKGDVDGSGVVDTDDAVAVLKHIVGIETLSGPILEAADIDGNGVDTDDAVYILQYVVGILSEDAWNQMGSK